MTDQQVLRYTQLCKRRMDILLHSGVSWLPEYEAELKSIDQELKELSEAKEAAHRAREEKRRTQSYQSKKANSSGREKGE